MPPVVSWRLVSLHRIDSLIGTFLDIMSDILGTLLESATGLGCGLLGVFRSRFRALLRVLASGFRRRLSGVPGLLRGFFRVLGCGLGPLFGVFRAVLAAPFTSVPVDF